MTEVLPLATSNATRLRSPVAAPESASHILPPIPLTIEDTIDDDDGEIACICAINEDDGNTIQCDKCLRWQHISCYYPPPKPVPGEDQKHYCTDCVPQEDVDSRKASERQRKALDQRHGTNGVKRPAAKSHKKKVKESPSLAPVNGWSDRHTHLHTHDRKSASPRDQQPPAKKPKTSHRSSGSVSQPAGRKRASTANALAARSPSRSPEHSVPAFIPLYSEEFLHLFQPHSPQVETNTNLMNNIAVTSLLSDWLTDPDAVSKVTGGMKQSEIFKRWDGQMDDIPGRPEVSVQWIEDPRYTDHDGFVPRWARLSLHEQIAAGTYIGELRGRIGHRDDYHNDPEGRWHQLNHPEPFVFFHPQLPIYIDARQEGSMFRFVRRSCQPNAELQTIITDGTEFHFCFMARKEIMAEEEVTIAWQVPDTIRARIESSLNTPAGFQPKVRDYISSWVSNVLANCGPCACNGQSSCLMAHYDRRGLAPPVPYPKSSKRRKKIPALDTVATSRSRSTSEVRKMDVEEDGVDSRSASGSRASASRDITPSTHYSGNASTGLPELSERERKKLMREEEMFRRQEEESGRPKKKRTSGGSALNTPSASSSFRPGQSLRYDDGQRNGNGNSVKYADSGTSSRPQIGSRTSSGRLKPKQSQKDVSSPRQLPDYVDSSAQCDLDGLGPLFPSRIAKPKKRYVSITQRLLQKCVFSKCLGDNAIKQPDTNGQPMPDTMDVDTKVEPEVAVPDVEEPPAPSPLHPNGDAKPDPIEPEQPAASDPAPVSDTVMADPETEQNLEIKEAETVIDAVIASSEPTMVEKVASETTSKVDEVTEPITKSIVPTVHPVLEQAEPEAERLVRPEMHLDMPPPPQSFNSGPRSVTTPSLLLAQSPLALTPTAAPLFSPSVTAAVTPSPIRKKLSLSDYTKRSKARESLGNDSVPTPGLSNLGRDGKDGDDAAGQEDAVVSPTPEAEPTKAISTEEMDEDKPDQSVAVAASVDQVMTNGDDQPTAEKADSGQGPAEDREAGEPAPMKETAEAAVASSFSVAPAAVMGGNPSG